MNICTEMMRSTLIHPFLLVNMLFTEDGNFIFQQLPIEFCGIPFIPHKQTHEHIVILFILATDSLTWKRICPA